MELSTYLAPTAPLLVLHLLLQLLPPLPSSADREMGRLFGLDWFRPSRGSLHLYCFGALASITAYYLISDHLIDKKRRQIIAERKTQKKGLYESLMIGGRFVNPFETWRDKTLWDFVRWISTRSTGNGLPKDRQILDTELPLAIPHFALLNALSAPTSRQHQNLSADPLPVEYSDYPAVDSVDGDKSLTVTWLGQSTCFVQMQGLNILTDPIFKRRTVYSWLGPERLRPVPCQLSDLPHPDIVLVSHNHFDHLDIDVVRALANSVTWYVPTGLASWFSGLGVTSVVELDWWAEDTMTVRNRDYIIAATPTQHWSGRNGADSNKSLWSSFLVKTSSASIFHCGDTGYCPVFDQVGAKYGPMSLAILPIGSYEPRWYMCHQHTNPEDAVLIHRDLRAKASVGVHWGTFMMSDEHYLQPPRDLEIAAKKYGLGLEEFIAPQFGKTYVYDL